jgi:EKC/KEOPS complex subunit PCC1/LAGE3
MSSRPELRDKMRGIVGLQWSASSRVGGGSAWGWFFGLTGMPRSGIGIRGAALCTQKPKLCVNNATANDFCENGRGFAVSQPGAFAHTWNVLDDLPQIAGVLGRRSHHYRGPCAMQDGVYQARQGMHQSPIAIANDDEQSCSSGLCGSDRQYVVADTEGRECAELPSGSSPGAAGIVIIERKPPDSRCDRSGPTKCAKGKSQGWRRGVEDWRMCGWKESMRPLFGQWLLMRSVVLLFARVVTKPAAQPLSPRQRSRLNPPCVPPHCEPPRQLLTLDGGHAFCRKRDTSTPIINGPQHRRHGDRFCDLPVRPKPLKTTPFADLPGAPFVNLLPPCRTLDIPLPEPRLASVALRALAVDKELSPLVQRSFSTVAGRSRDGESVLRVEYKASTNRMLRVAVNSFLDSLALVIEVMEELDVDVLESQKQDSTSNS